MDVMTPEPAPSLPQYDVERMIGVGGMATVYLATDRVLGRQVALKVLKTQMLKDEGFKQRFVREGRLLAKLDHPHIVRIYEMSTLDDTYYLAMEYLPHGSLKDRLKALASQKALMPREEVLQLVKVIANTLQTAHEAAVVHRDLTPANILFARDGRPVLTDFGIAKLMPNDNTAVDADKSAVLTYIGATLGTPKYMCPEQIEDARKADYRSDLYSVGVILYELLTGRPPFEGSWYEVVHKHLNEPVPRLPKPLAAYQPLLDQLLSKSPDQRPTSARAVAATLERLEGLERSQKHSKLALPWGGMRSWWAGRGRRWLGWAGGIAGVILVIAAGAVVLSRGGSPPPPREPVLVNVMTWPWTQVYLDEVFVGTTPLKELPIDPGEITLRFVNDQEAPPLERTIAVEFDAAVGARRLVCDFRADTCHLDDQRLP